MDSRNVSVPSSRCVKLRMANPNVLGQILEGCSEGQHLRVCVANTDSKVLEELSDWLVYQGQVPIEA